MATRVKYYGVRGSTPAIGSAFIKFGGHTTCVFIEHNNTKIIIDAGTGIRSLSNEIKQLYGPDEVMHYNMLFTHTHWDHIQGFPFFESAYSSNTTIDIYGMNKPMNTIPDHGDQKFNAITNQNSNNCSIEQALQMQQNYMYFPIGISSMPAKKQFFHLNDISRYYIDDIIIDTIRLPHPNETVGFKFTFGKKKGIFCFCTDIEHNDKVIERLIDFTQDIDVLAYDCQYTPEEYSNGKRGWGHSTYAIGTRIAKEARIKELHMIHHDPYRGDNDLIELERHAKKINVETIAVREGHTIIF